MLNYLQGNTFMLHSWNLLQCDLNFDLVVVFSDI